MQTGKKISNEKLTVRAMIGLYCRGHHASNTSLCPDCARLAAYCTSKLDKCPFGSNKPACSNCNVHCYDTSRREEIKKVMRYAGPRMIYRHPGLSVIYSILSINSASE